MSLIIKNESQNTEFKESWRDEYLKWICGFANANGGKIYIGVQFRIWATMKEYIVKGFTMNDDLLKRTDPTLLIKKNK